MLSSGVWLLSGQRCGRCIIYPSIEYYCTLPPPPSLTNVSHKNKTQLNCVKLPTKAGSGLWDWLGFDVLKSEEIILWKVKSCYNVSLETEEQNSACLYSSTWCLNCQMSDPRPRTWLGLELDDIGVVPPQIVSLQRGLPAITTSEC